jgi:hypothetical protein
MDLIGSDADVIGTNATPNSSAENHAEPSGEPNNRGTTLLINAEAREHLFS